MRQKYFFYPFAVAGDLTVIPDPTQTSGSVSFQQGYGFDYERQLGVDPLALPINRSADNWLFNAITEAIQAQQQFFAPEWITTANNDGTPFAYDYGAIVRYSASGLPPFTTYQSVLAGASTNTSVPGTDANWRELTAVALWQAGGTPTYASPGVYTLPNAPIADVPLYFNGAFLLSGVADTTSGITMTVSGVNLTVSPLPQATDVLAFGAYRY